MAETAMGRIIEFDMNLEQFSETLKDHFRNPRNAGRLEDADAVGTAGGGKCSDTMTIFLKVRDDAVERITFLCDGCPPAIACGSILTELATGEHLDAAAEIAPDTVVAALDGLPREYRHLAYLAVEALDNAIWNYIARHIEQNDFGME